MRGGELNPWWRIGVAVVTPLVRLLFRVRVRGLEHVPLQGPAILAFNHLSTLDGPVLAAEVATRLRREVRFLTAAEFFGHRFFGWVLRTFDQIAIRRGESDGAALDEAIETIRQGALAALAPEGAVNPEPAQLMRVRSGIARIALPTGAPIVPVGIWGTHRRFPKSGLHVGRPWRPPLAIAFGDPILPVGDVESAEDVDRIVGRVGERLATVVEEARGMAGPEPRR